MNISRISELKHFFIDSMFGVVPSGYQQLINIAIIDKVSDVLPVCWILTNSKDYLICKIFSYLISC